LLKYAKANYAKGKLIIWGSSYSAALSIKLASEYPKTVNTVLSFSPGEYFSKPGKNHIAEAAKTIHFPVFITSAKNEASKWAGIYGAIPSKSKQKFVPTTAGNHGSRALWKRFPDSKDYWAAVNGFLKQFLPNP
jgi:predicted alpha/beta superfamily hydrolase